MKELTMGLVDIGLQTAGFLIHVYIIIGTISKPQNTYTMINHWWNNNHLTILSHHCGVMSVWQPQSIHGNHYGAGEHSPFSGKLWRVVFWLHHWLVAGIQLVSQLQTEKLAGLAGNSTLQTQESIVSVRVCLQFLLFFSDGFTFSRRYMEVLQDGTISIDR